MSKKDKSQVAEPQVAEVSEAEKLEKFKASKKEAARRFKEKRAKEKADRIENAKKLMEVLQRDGIWDNLGDDMKSFVSGMANPQLTAAGNTSVFSKLFGDNPQPGATFTLTDAFNKTLKGKANIDHLVSKWAEKGIVVSFKKDDANILNSVYTLESISDSAAKAE